MPVHVTGDGLEVQDAAGVVVSMAVWILDPVECAGMTTGAPRVDLAALIELNQVLTDAERNRRSPDESAVVQEERDEDTRTTSSRPPRLLGWIRPKLWR